MTDKAREEFEEWVNLNGGAPEHTIPLMRHVWLAAKEKYEPRWVPASERLPEPLVHVALIDTERFQNCPEEMVERCHIKDVGYYNPEWKCWSVRGQPGFSKSAYTHWLPLPLLPSAPSTQGEE